MPQFESTIKHLTGGVKKMALKTAITNIEGWQKKLDTLEVPGVKGVSANLGKLKKHLQAEELDAAAIKALLIKLGGATVNISKKAQGATAAKIAKLGGALVTAGDKLK